LGLGDVDAGVVLGVVDGVVPGVVDGVVPVVVVGVVPGVVDGLGVDGVVYASYFCFHKSCEEEE